MTNPIRQAVLPLKAAAQDRAEKEARAMVQRMAEQLEAAGWDLNEAAPRPSSLHESRNSYLAKQSKRLRYSAVTSSWMFAPSLKYKTCGKSEPVFIDEDKVEIFVQKARQNAADQYDLFVAKIESKIGETSAARLDGDHVWGYSFLTVRAASGQAETWKTQMIVNCSKLGLLFNQFPTRKIKDTRAI